MPLDCLIRDAIPVRHPADQFARLEVPIQEITLHAYRDHRLNSWSRRNP